MKRRLLFTLVLFMAWPAACGADSFLLKSGEMVRGKLVEKKGDIFVVLTGDGTVEIPFSRIAIADIDPASEAMPKGNVSVIGTGRLMEPAQPARDDRPVRVIQDEAPQTPEVPHFANSGILKKAEDTVKLSNERTAATVKVLEEMKGIADAANSG